MIKYSDITKRLKVDVPVGRSGDWCVERMEVDERGAQAHNFHEAIRGGMRLIDPGTYTKLTCHGAIVMSDTPSEISDHLPAIYNAHGHVLIAGLGLGVVVNGCLMDGVDRNGKTVDKVTVVEKSLDVITLVAGHYRNRFGNRLEVVHDDILTWKPPKGERYGTVWMDIWDDICTDNLDDMRQLKAKFRRRTEWIGCWSEVECLRYRRREGYYG